MLVTLPFVLLLLDWWPLRRCDGYGRFGRFLVLVREKVPLLALAAASSVITFLVQRAGGAVTGLDALPVRLRLENAVISYAAYLGKMVWPVDLAIVYGRPEEISTGLVIVALLGLGTASALALRLGRRRPYVAVGWLWYLGTLVPVIGVVQVGVQAMADRYTYVPLIGIFIVIAWGVHDLVRARPALARAAAAAAVAIAALCALVARQQVTIWKDNGTLFAHAAAVTLGVDSAAAHVRVGITLLEQGRVDEAVRSFLEARRLAPGDAETHYHLGLAYARQGRFAEASAALADAIRIHPDHANAYAALGLAAAQQGRAHEAIAHYRQALRLDPTNADVHNNLGSALAHERRLEEALPAFREAVRLRPDFHDARINLAVALAALGRRDEATAQLDEVLRRDPSNVRARAMIRR
jgi:Flp pilus assembly protein TadD